MDDRLTLWIDGKLAFGEGLSYEPSRRPAMATAEDLLPARVGALKAAFEVKALLLTRDVYYTLEPADCDYANFDGAARPFESVLELLSDPQRFSGSTPSRATMSLDGVTSCSGDNSPEAAQRPAWGQSDQFDPEFPQQGWDK